MKSSNHPLAMLGIAATSLLPYASGATSTWTGGQAGNPAWGQAANWDTPPAFDDAQELVFYQSGAAQADRSNLGADRLVNRITINGNVDADMLIAMENNTGGGRQLRFAGTNAGIFIDADATGNIRIGEAAANNEGNNRILDGATFSGTGKGIDIVHNGTGELILSGTTVFFEADASGAGAGAPASVAKSGTGTLTIEQGSALTGTFYLTEGRVNLNTGGAAGNPGVDWVFSDGVTLGNTSNGQVTIGANPSLTLLGDLNYLSEASRNLEIGNTLTSTITLEADSTITVGSSGDANFRPDGVIEESGGSHTLTKAGPGILRLRAPIHLTGGVVVSEGELHLGENGGAIATVTDPTTPITINANCLIVDRGGVTDRAWDNVVGGDGGLMKIDGHTLTLNADNTYTGTTTVSGGTLVVNGTHTGGAIPSLYEISATLAGDGGSTESDVTLAPGATLDPGKGGFSIGLDDLSLHDLAGATLAIEIDGVGDHDTLTYTGTLTLGDLTDGDAVLDVSGSDIVAPTASPITIIEGLGTSSIDGQFAGLPQGATFVAGAQLFEIDYLGGDGNDVVLTPLNDPVIGIAADTSEASEGGTAGFTISAIPSPNSGSVTVDLTYGGTATDGSDFSGQTSVVIPDGSPSADLDLALADDGLVEGVEILEVSIAGVSGSGAVVGSEGSARVFVRDGNSPPVDGPAINETLVDAGSPVIPGAIVISDEAGGGTGISSGATAPAFTYSGGSDVAIFGGGFTGEGNDFNAAAEGDGSQNGFQLVPDPAKAPGFSLELVFTPRTADLFGSRCIWEIGGTSNGSGVYLIDGVPHLISKMNTGGASEPTGLTDTDWTGNAICVPLTPLSLLANQRSTIALRFSLDALEHSVNGSGPTLTALTNRNGLDNWHGYPDINFGTVDTNIGARGGLSTNAGTFLADDFTDLADGIAAIQSCRFWNATDGTIDTTAGTPELITATITIRDWTSDAASGSLSAASGNGETYSNGVWTGPAGLASLNTALAALQFFPGTDPVSVLDISIDDQTSTGETTGTLIIANSAPTTVYVDDDFTEGRGDAVTDGDLVTAGDQGAIFGYSAFRSLAEATSLVDPAGLVIVNDGDYSAESATLDGTATLRLTDSTGGVSIGALTATEGTTLELQGNDLTLGNDGPVTYLDAVVSGTGSLIKTGTSRIALRTPSTYSGGTIVNDGFFRIGSVGGSATLLGSVASPVTVNAPGVLEINAADTATTLTHSTLISGDGSVAATGPGTTVLDGPANPFTGNFVLGYGTTSDINEILGTGNQNGIVLISDAAQLGNGLIESRGAQLRSSIPDLIIPNDIEIYGGGLRLGGANDFELSGAIVPVNSLRGIGNYSGDGVTFTVSGTIDLDGSGAPFNVNIDGIEGADNGTVLVSADIIGTGNFGVNGNFDGGTVILGGANTYGGTTFLDGSSTTWLNGSHTGGGIYTVDDSTTLGGTGFIEGLVTINSGGFLAPGTTIGTLRIGGGVTFNDMSNFEIEIDSGTLTADLLDSDFEVSIGTGVSLVGTDLAASPAVLPLGTTFTILDYYDDIAAGTSILSGEFDGLPEGGSIAIGANQFTISYAADLRDAVGAPGSDGVADAITLTAAGSSSAYLVWSSDYPGLTGGFGDDDDGDGVSNGFEWYFFGSDPTAPEALGSPILATSSSGAGSFTFSHRRPVNRSGATEAYEWSTNLTDWNASDASDGSVTVSIQEGATTPDTDPDYEIVEITATVTAGSTTEVFVRLDLTSP